ncbi:T9SS type A sorting domain-containing protein [Lacinutrix chionoecetis]
MKNFTLLIILLSLNLGFSQQQIYNLGFESGDPDGDINAWTTFDPPAPAFEIVTNPDPDGVNPSATTQVLKLNMVGAAPCYAGAVNFHGTLGTWELDAAVPSNLSLSMDVNRSSTNGVVGIKFANATNGTVFEITDAQGQVSAADTWETLTWDISGFNVGDNVNIDQMVVFIDFTCGGPDTTEDVQLLVDNITWGANKLSEPTEPFDGTINFDANAAWGGFMNVFELPENGGAYQFGSGWAVPDLKTVINTGNSTMTLQPNFNTYADNSTDAFWVNQTTLEGNKDMEASTVIGDNSLVGQTFTFTGNVSSNTLDVAYNAYAFIRIFDGGFTLLEEITAPLTAGSNYNVTYNNSQPGAVNIQYGFTVRGRNANPANEAALGNIIIQPASLGVTEFNILDTVKVYPNPTSNSWQMTSHEEILDIEIFDILGKQVTKMQPNVNNFTVDASYFETGMYLAKLSTASGNKTFKLIKQ